MPNRIIRDWTDSERIDSISFQAEVLLVRLMMKADDLGAYHANPKLINSFCFPLKNIRETDITRWLQELASAGIIALYTADNKSFLHIINFGQRLRTVKPKYPQISEKELNFYMAAACQQIDDKPPLEEETETEEEIEEEEEGKSSTPNFDNGNLFPEENKVNPDEEERKKVAQKKESEIVDYFHEKCKKLPRVQVLSEKRITSIKTRLKDHGEENVLKVIKMSGESKFLSGDNPKNWTADFDWIFNSANFIKIMEGNYKNKEYNFNTNSNGSAQAKRR